MDTPFNFIDFFIDPLLRAPTIGTLLMAFSAACVGTILLEKKESLIAEALSHASYPGILFAVLFMGALSTDSVWPVYIGAAFFAAAALFFLRFLQEKVNLSQDISLCLALSLFFGLGVLLASQIQFLFPSLYVQVPIYLFGQAVTLTESHLLYLAPLSGFVLFFVFLFYKEWKVMVFDPSFAHVQGIPKKPLSTLFYALLICSLVIGMRACGVLLLSSLYLMPALAARQLSNHFGRVMCLSALIAMFGSLLGLIIAVSFSSKGLSLPSGPMIVLVLAQISFFLLLFSPDKGILYKAIAHFRFKRICARENYLKHLWRKGKIPASSGSYFLKRALLKKGFIKRCDHQIVLTDSGRIQAKRIVRLHRLWELYLVNWVGLNKEKVHKSAEEIEHVITPELEAELTLLLQDPKYDPHHQPIPQS